MRARAEVAVAPGGQLARLRCEPPLTVRRVHAERTDVCALCLVGTAAGPLAGDDLALELTVLAGAQATLAATGATIAQGSPRSGSLDGTPSRLVLKVSVHDGARLYADPGALVVCDGANVDLHVQIDLAATASVQWGELVVLGRTGAPAGAATVRWDVVRAGEPLLRQRVDLADRALMPWPGLIAGRRVLATALLAGPDIEGRLEIDTTTAMAQPLDEHAVLITVLADDAATAGAQIDDLSARILARPALAAR